MQQTQLSKQTQAEFCAETVERTRYPDNHDVRTSEQHTAKHSRASAVCTKICKKYKMRMVLAGILNTSLTSFRPSLRVALCSQLQQQLCNGSKNICCASMSQAPHSPLATIATTTAAACCRISAEPPTSNTQWLKCQSSIWRSAGRNCLWNNRYYNSDI